MSLASFFSVSKSQDVRDFPALTYSGACLDLWLDWVIFSQHLSPQSYILVFLDYHCIIIFYEVIYFFQPVLAGTFWNTC